MDSHPDMAMGAKSHWELAGKLAARMLPQVFKPQSPVFQLVFAPEHQRELERLLAALPGEVFQASDSLGWVYQFWQAKRMDEVNASEVKIGADELPAVTQLFTEPYMVDFLLHNSLGAWWVTPHPNQPCPVPLTCLRLLPSPSGRGEGGEGATTPHSRRLHDVPQEHAAFARSLRASQTDAENLIWSLLRNRRLADCKFRRQHPIGSYVLDFYCHEKILAIELDGGQHNEESRYEKDAARTTYLARHGIRVLRFWNNQALQETEAVLQAIWNELTTETPSPPTPLPEGEGLIPAAGTFEGWPERLSDFKLLDPCCGSGHFLAAAFLMLVPMRMQAEGLSAVDAVLADNLHGLETDARCVEIAVFALALATERPATLWGQANELQYDSWGLALTAKGALDAARLLDGRYHLVATNVPYLARGKQHSALKDYCDAHYAEAKSDLANVFLERCQELALDGRRCVVQAFLPQGWLYLASYKRQRQTLLRTTSWNLLARHGSGAFEGIGGEVVSVVLFTLTPGRRSREVEHRHAGC